MSDTISIRDGNAVISEVQRFLLEISYVEEGYPHVTIDGFYDRETVDNVRLFQRKQGLPVTGTIDNVTYDHLYQNYLSAMKKNGRSV